MSMRMKPMNECPIWPGSSANIQVLDTDARLRVESARAGGEYEISILARDSIEGWDDGARARLTTWLVDQRLLGVRSPMVTQEIVEYAKTKRPLYPWERAERLLRFIFGRMKTIGDHADVRRDDPEPYAWSESTTLEEVFYLFGYLEQNKWIDNRFFADGGFNGRVTVDGYAKLAEQQINADSSQAFVAMWFDGSMNEAYETGIGPAIETAGYHPIRIDQKLDVNKIYDEIVAEIRRSRFLVADVTHGNDGARGGVYFEAGFAMGLDLPVIFTCRIDMVDKLHFDTRQFAHIVWGTPEELRDGLKHRILARIGEGPLHNPAGQS